MPKRTFYRIVILLAALAGIIYLRERTGSIAGCMADAFRVPPAAEQTPSSAPLRARVVLPPAPSENSP